MTVSPAPQQIREIVAQVFSAYDVLIDDEVIDETILIQGGRYFARSYRTEELLAMWFVESGFIQFYDADGQMLRTVNLRQELVQQRMAA